MKQKNYKYSSLLYFFRHRITGVDRSNDGFDFLYKSQLILCNKESVLSESDREPKAIGLGEEIASFYLDAVRGEHIFEAVLGSSYYEGKIIKQDYKEAFYWSLKAAKYGIGMDESQCLVGRMYELGQGVDRDYTKAIDWYLKAAAQDNILANARLSELFLKEK